MCVYNAPLIFLCFEYGYANTDFSNKSANCDVTFVNWNVKSLNHPTKRKKVLTQLRKLKAGIVFLQEMHLQTFDHFRLRGGWIRQSYHSNFHFILRMI